MLLAELPVAKHPCARESENDSNQILRLSPSTLFTKVFRKLTVLNLSENDHNDAENYNFDHPNALDFDLAFEKIQELVQGRDTYLPCYDFASHSRT